MKTIGAFEAKTHFSRLLREVEINRVEIVVEKHNRPVACIVPCASPDTVSRGEVDVVSGLREIRNTAARSSETIQELVAEGRKR